MKRCLSLVACVGIVLQPGRAQAAAAPGSPEGPGRHSLVSCRIEIVHEDLLGGERHRSEWAATLQRSQTGFSVVLRTADGRVVAAHELAAGVAEVQFDSAAPRLLSAPTAMPTAVVRLSGRLDGAPVAIDLQPFGQEAGQLPIQDRYESRRLVVWRAPTAGLDVAVDVLPALVSRLVVQSDHARWEYRLLDCYSEDSPPPQAKPEPRPLPVPHAVVAWVGSCAVVALLLGVLVWVVPWRRRPELLVTREDAVLLGALSRRSEIGSPDLEPAIADWQRRLRTALARHGPRLRGGRRGARLVAAAERLLQPVPRSPTRRHLRQLDRCLMRIHGALDAK